MDQSDKYNWTIIYSDYKKELLHLDHLKNSNPDATILVCDISQYSFLDSKYCWKNNDALIRNWIRANRHLIKTPNILLIEWDVLVTKKLPPIKVDGLMVKNIHSPVTNNWYWFKESNLLGPYQKNRIGITPFGVMMMNQNCIDTWIDHEFDPLYCANINCELRFPTLINSRQIPISQIPFSMPNVSATKSEYKNIPDIYHPIKQKIYTTGT